MLRTSTSLLALLLLAPVAIAQPEYSSCIEATDPPACLARIAATNGADISDKFDAVVRHGLIDRVASLRWNLRNTVGRQYVSRDDKPLSDKTTLAAVALLTAARHKEDPFADPTFQKLAAKAPDRAAIPFVAIHLWLEQIWGGNTYDMQVQFAGLPKIFAAIAADESLNRDAVTRLASHAAWYPETRGLALPLLRRAATRSDLSASQKTELASGFARLYGFADDADRLMRAGGESAPDYDIVGVQAEIATARLKSGYDAASARTIVKHLLANMQKQDLYLKDFDNEELGALEHSGAQAELREVGRAYEQQAALMGNDAGKWLAFASDCYLRAGDREAAIKTARLGLKYVPEAVTDGMPHSPTQTPQELARRAQGTGTEPVIALYRAGGISEALEFGYLAGKDRYFHARRAGEQPHPQWVIDDGWELYVWAMVGTAIKEEPATVPRVLAAFKNSCPSLTQAQCGEDMVFNFAHLAAAAGDRQLMHSLFANAARDLEKIDDGLDTQASFAVRLAAHWAHALEMLHTPRSVSPTP